MQILVGLAENNFKEFFEEAKIKGLSLVLTLEMDLEGSEGIFEPWDPVGGYESLEYWFSGLALSGIPFTYYEIGKLGFNTETFFQDLSDELQRITGYSDRKAYNRKLRA